MRKQVAVLLGDEVVARVDALARQWSKPWLKVTRSEALRRLILTGLEVEEKRQSSPPLPAPTNQSSRRPKSTLKVVSEP